MPKQAAAPQKPDYQDVLTFKPAAIKIVRDAKKAKILKDPLYFPIIKSLRKGPMTVRQLEKEYGVCCAGSDAYEPKSDKTIYRYLKVLEAAELVVPAGQRVVMGKTATETLFARTARAFLIQARETKPEEKEKERQLVHRIGRLLGRLYENREPDLACCEKFFARLEKDAKVLQERLLGSADEETLELATSGDWEEIDEILRAVTTYGLLLEHPDLLDELRACFEKGKPATTAR